MAIKTTGAAVRKTVTIDDALYRQARKFVDPAMSKSGVVREALRVFVEVQSRKRLAAISGIEGGAATQSRDRLQRLPAGSRPRGAP